MSSAGGQRPPANRMTLQPLSLNFLASVSEEDILATTVAAYCRSLRLGQTERFVVAQISEVSGGSPLHCTARASHVL